MRARLPRRLVFAVPGDIEARTGGTIYDRRVIAALREAGWTVELVHWPASFPFPSGADRIAVAASLAAQPDNALVLIDGLAFGALPDLAAREGARLRLVALVHHPLALETGLAPAARAALAVSEAESLAHARAVITTSATTAAALRAGFGVSGEITVAAPGVDAATPPSARMPGPPRLISVGSLTPRKAHQILIEALEQVSDLDWTCVIAGDTRDTATAQALERQAAGLRGRVTLAGAVSDQAVRRLYGEADLFVLASVYEGYGMVFAEALAHGVPVVGTTGGAIPEAVPPDAGVLVQPGDAVALAGAIRAILREPARLASLRAGALRARSGLKGWRDTAATIAARLERL